MQLLKTQGTLLSIVLLGKNMNLRKITVAAPITEFVRVPGLLLFSPQ